MIEDRPPLELHEGAVEEPSLRTPLIGDDNRIDRRRAGIAYPWKTVNEEFGPIQAGTVHVVLGRPNNGKTAYMLSLADSLLRTNVPFVYLGTESAPEYLITKLATSRLGVAERVMARDEWDTLDAGDLDLVKQEIVVVEHSACLFPSLPFLSADSLRTTFLRAVNTLQDDYGVAPRVVFVDHLQRIKRGAKQSAFEAIGESMQFFSGFSRETGISVVVASQMKRGDRESALDLALPPNLGSGRGSGDIEAEAFTIHGLYRPLQSETSLKTIRAIAAGTEEVATHLKRSTAGLVYLKNRGDGSMVGKRVELSVRSGLFVDYHPIGSGDEDVDIPF